MGEFHVLFVFLFGYRLVLAASASAVYQTGDQARFALVGVAGGFTGTPHV